MSSEITKHKTKDWVLAAAFTTVAALLVSFAAFVLRPVHNDYGSTWAQYLCEPEDSIDILFLGSSYAYCDWNPEIIYGASGLTGYVMAGSEQTPSITYWYLKEALKTQSPQAVIMEGSSFFFAMYQNYTQINLGYMPRGINRTCAIFDAAEPEKRFGLFFDLYFYHDRWKSLTREDVAKIFSPPRADEYKGYTFLDVVCDVSGAEPNRREFVIDEETYAKHLEAFSKIAQLCHEKGISLIISINPTYNQYAPEIYAKLRDDLTAIDPSTDFINLSNAFDEIDIDLSHDMYDFGHLNFFGAYKFSEWTGKFLMDKGFTPRTQSEENQAAWQSGARYWEQKLVELSGHAI